MDGSPFYLQKDQIYAVPIIHYNMEMAAQVKLAFEQIQPDCVAVELAETMQLQLLHAASRLPDITVVSSHNHHEDHATYYMCEPCDGAFEGLRSALEYGRPAFCIDLDVRAYPETHEQLPDPYAIHRIGLKQYYEAYQSTILQKTIKGKLDQERELYMAKRLKELSLSYEKILFIGGMLHVEEILKLTERNSFPALKHAEKKLVQISTLTEDSCREVMAETGWVTCHYEESRQQLQQTSAVEFPPDRQKLLLGLFKAASERYIGSTGAEFPGYHMRNLMKFVRNYAILQNKLMPDLFQLLTAAKGCVDHNYAYETWQLATHYPYRKNVDGLNEISLSANEVWGNSKMVRFYMRENRRKGGMFHRRRKDRSKFRFEPPGPFSICSHPPEDVVVERFGEFLKKKGTQILTEDSGRTLPFTTSIEDGIDTRETIRHWFQKKLYVKVRGKPPGGVGSVVVIFDEDKPQEGALYNEKYPWKTTWLGEHDQESDMAFYSTYIGENVVGPGISRCEYGAFLLSYPPRRMHDVWSDSDYQMCHTKAEVLLMAAIDYAVKPVIVYVAASPPRSLLKSFARRFGKKVVYIPIGQLSAVTVQKLRTFHVLDGHDKRTIADEYIN